MCLCAWLQLHAEYSERLKDLKRFELKLQEQFHSKEQVGAGARVIPCGEPVCVVWLVQELEASVFRQRQALLREMDSMKNREALSLRAVAVSRETLSGEATRVESLLQEVHKREASLQQVQRLAEETAHQ